MKIEDRKAEWKERAAFRRMQKQAPLTDRQRELLAQRKGVTTAEFHARIENEVKNGGGFYK